METMKRRTYASRVTTGALGLALISLAACSSGESTTGTPAPGSSAGASSALVFVNNAGDGTLTSVALRGDSNNEVLKPGTNGEPNPIPAAEFGNVALGDMQMTEGDWVFVNLGAADKVAAIDVKTAAIPVREVNLPTGTRPVHIYRSENDREVVWIMNDGDDRTSTPGDDLVNCNNPARVGGPVVGGSVTAVHNSHLGPGAVPPRVLGTTCILADGHKVAAFSSGAGVPKRVFVSSETAGEIAVIDDQEGTGTYRQMIYRIDLCNQSKENGLQTPATCNSEDATGTTPFTPNNSAPHGIRWSKLTKKIYSLQEGYQEIAEIDPVAVGTSGAQVITKKFDLSGTSYTGYGISPDGRYLLLRGETTNPEQAVKLGVIDLSATTPAVADLDIPVLNGATNGSFQTGGSSFKFSPNGKRLYFLVGNSNSVTVTKKDRLFAFDTSTLSATPPALTLVPSGEIPLLQTGRHSMDIYAEEAGEAKYVVVSNRGAAGSLSIINAIDNTIKDTVTVGTNPGAVLVYRAGAVQAGNQASN